MLVVGRPHRSDRLCLTRRSFKTGDRGTLRIYCGGSRIRAVTMPAGCPCFCCRAGRRCCLLLFAPPLILCCTRRRTTGDVEDDEDT